MKRLLPVLLLVVCLPVFAQIAPIVQPHQQFFGIDGKPLAGGLIYSYAAGTTTPLATYADSTGSTQNPNPVILDASGSADIWLAASAYKFIVLDQFGNTQWTVDNVQGLGAPTVPQTNGQSFGSNSKRWAGYFTTIDVSGSITVTGDSTFAGLLTADRLAGKSINGDIYSSKYASLNAAVNAVTAGHVVYVDADSTITATVTVPTGVGLICRPGVTITKGMNADAIALSSNSVLYGCKIDGNKVSFPSGKNIKLDTITTATVSNVESINSAEQGLYSIGSSNVVITGNKFSGNYRNAIQVTNGGSHIVIANNPSVDCSGGLTNQSDCITVYAESTPSAGHGPSDVSIANNVMMAGADDFCVEIGNFSGLDDPINIAVTGNTCKATANGANGGYSINTADVVTVTGNSYYGNGFTNTIAGLECAGCVHVTFSGNVVEAYGTGVLVSQSDTDVAILNNDIRTATATATDWCVNVENAVVSASISRVAIKDNKCMVITAGSNGIQAQCNALSANCSDFSISGNDVVGSTNASGIGIQVDQSNGTLTRAQVAANNVLNWLVGINISSAQNVALMNNYARNVGGYLGGGTPGTGFIADDINGFTFTKLGSFTNGSRIYCADCTIASPCAGSGTGAIAKRLNGVWVCN